MNNNESQKIYCQRCGAEMNSNSRYCMKCGNLNYDHNANETMRPYIQDNPTGFQGGYQVGSGTNINNSSDQSTIKVANNTGSYVLCYIFNFAAYLIVLVFLLISAFNQPFESIKDFFSSIYPLFGLIVSYLCMYIYSLQLIAMKCNKRWWSVFIPIYNIMMLSEVVYGNKWLGIITLIPIIGQLFFIIMLYKLGQRFQYNGFLTIILTFIIIPAMGFGSHFLDGNIYLGKDRTLENDYKLKKTYFVTAMVVMIFGFVCTFWNNIVNINENVQKVRYYHYVYSSKKVVEKIEMSLRKEYVSCNYRQFDKNNGVYYFYYPDLGKRVFLPLNYFNDPLEAYVKLEIVNGEAKYYVSLTDGKNGFGETLSDDVDFNAVGEYHNLNLYFDMNSLCDTGK